MLQIKDYRRDVNDVGLAGPLLKIPGSATGDDGPPALVTASRLRSARRRPPRVVRLAPPGIGGGRVPAAEGSVMVYCTPLEGEGVGPRGIIG
jgi:hypothetical protein